MAAKEVTRQSFEEVDRLMGQYEVPQRVKNALKISSTDMPADAKVVRGYDFKDGVDHHELLNTFKYTGFQATNFGLAVEEIKKMTECRAKPLPDGVSPVNALGREHKNCTIFLGYTSNMISAGVRETIKFLVKNKMVDVIVTTAGGIEEDFIKCFSPTYLGRFDLKGKDLYPKGIFRIGNLVIPNHNYLQFHHFINPILDQMLEEQKTKGTHWTPSRFINRMGQEINNEDSVYYWAYKNDIPVFCPAITDGAIGDILFMHGYKNPGLKLDIVKDVQLMNTHAVMSQNSGIVILGGGLVKHHICNANCMRTGADFSVFINTANEFDGSDAGARPDEAVSWGKIKIDASPVKVFGEASIIFPLLVAETFARDHHKKDSNSNGEK